MDLINGILYIADNPNENITPTSQATSIERSNFPRNMDLYVILTEGLIAIAVHLIDYINNISDENGKLFLREKLHPIFDQLQYMLEQDRNRN